MSLHGDSGYYKLGWGWNWCVIIIFWIFFISTAWGRVGFNHNPPAYSYNLWKMSAFKAKLLKRERNRGIVPWGFLASLNPKHIHQAHSEISNQLFLECITLSFPQVFSDVLNCSLCASYGWAMGVAQHLWRTSDWKEITCSQCSGSVVQCFK